jgi:hypothetical protein
MNIYAVEGHKVKVATNELREIVNGYDYDKNKVKENLSVDKEYTVLYTIVDRSRTEVRLKEIPKVYFNSVSFIDAVDQSYDDDKTHQDYSTYN